MNHTFVIEIDSGLHANPNGCKKTASLRVEPQYRIGESGCPGETLRGPVCILFADRGGSGVLDYIVSGLRAVDVCLASVLRVVVLVTSVVGGSTSSFNQSYSEPPNRTTYGGFALISPHSNPTEVAHPLTPLLTADSNRSRV